MSKSNNESTTYKLDKKICDNILKIYSKLANKYGHHNTIDALKYHFCEMSTEYVINDIIDILDDENSKELLEKYVVYYNNRIREYNINECMNDVIKILLEVMNKWNIQGFMDPDPWWFK